MPGESDATAAAALNGGGGGYSGRGAAPSSPRAGKFVGLLNQGATCYLNSLVVSLFMTPEIRRGLYSLSAADLVVPLAPGEVEATASEAKAPEEPKVDQSTVDALVGMGFGEQQVRRAIRKYPYDPDNMQRVEFILSGDADVADTAPAAVAAVPAAPEPKTKERRIPKELQVLFARMQATDANVPQSTKRLTDCFGAGFSGGVQHDVHELNRILFDRIEKQLRGTPIQSLINDLYRGTMVNRIQCKSCGHKSEREEDYLDLSLIVGDFANVLESLHNSVQDEELSGDNLYECSGCNKKVEALKGARIRTVPPVLILSLSRFEYDKQTWQRVKNSKSFPFPEQLDMAPFMERQEGSCLYDLFGVVIHRGEQASHGHYHAYLLDVLNESKQMGTPLVSESDREDSFSGWFDFNDSHVSPIAPETVRSQYGGAENKAECAYMLIYRRRDSPLLNGNQQIPVLPPHLAAEIIAENEEVNRKRAEWEEMKNKIEIVLHVPSMLENDVNGGFIRLVDPGKGKEEEDDNDEDDRLTRPLKVLIDRRQTLGDLKALARSLFGDMVPDVPEMHMHRIRFLGNEQRVKFMRPLDRPMAQDGSELVYDDSAILDSLSTVTHGCEVLAWDGRHLFGEPFELAYDIITLCTTYYDQDDKATKYDLHVREGSTLTELTALLRARENIPETEEILVFRVDYAKLTNLGGARNADKTLRELYVNDHSNISFEKKQPGAPASDAEGQASRAAAAARLAEEARNVFVTNNCDATVVRDAIRCTLGMTVWDLKTAIVKQIGSLNERMPMRLRRSKVGGGEGSLFADEGASLRKAGIEDNMRVILEYGEPPDAASITVKFTWGTVTGVKLLGEMQSICVEVSKELRELKALIVASLHLENPVESFRLRRTDYWGNLREIFDEEEKTLKALSFKDSDCVWLEEGLIPPKGMIELQIELQTLSSSLTGPTKTAGDIWDTVNVATVQMLRTGTLTALRELIRADSVLGAMVGTKAFRLWCKGKLLRGEDKSLKKLGILTSCSLCLQVLPTDQELPEIVAETSGAVVLQLRQRLVESKTFSPPVETILIAQRRANQHLVRRAELIKHIVTCANLPSEGEQRLLVAKLVTQSGRWRVIIDPFEEEDAGADKAPSSAASSSAAAPPQGAKALQKKQTERKKADEIFLTDGDLIVWKRVADDMNNMDDFVPLLNKMYGETYVSTGSSSGNRIEAGPRNKPREIGLHIDDDGW